MCEVKTKAALTKTQNFTGFFMTSDHKMKGKTTLLQASSGKLHDDPEFSK